MQSQLWDAAVQSRSVALQAIRDLKVTLPTNPVAEKNVGSLNAKVSQVREYSNAVRDHIFDAQASLIGLRAESYAADDVYNERLAEWIQSVCLLPEDEKKKMPKSAEEREIVFRLTCPTQYRDKLDANRRVEEWELYQKMLYTIYYSLRDTTEDISSQIAVIKQQYFSGEAEVSKSAASIYDFLSDGAKQLLTGEPRTGDLIPAEEGPDSMEVVL